LLSSDATWLVAAILIGAVVPFTLAVVMPTNRRLLEPNRDHGSAQTRALLQKWNRLHAVRTASSVLSSLIYLWLLRGT
jgi:hypothetical protein